MDEQSIRKGGLVFSKDAPILPPKTEEEKEVYACLNRKMHADDLEDDFISLAEGVVDEEETDEDSEYEESTSASYENKVIKEKKEEKSTQRTSSQPRLVPENNFSALIEQINAVSSKGFTSLSGLVQKKRAPAKKKKQANNIEECNFLLNQLSSLYSPENNIDTETDNTKNSSNNSNKNNAKNNRKTKRKIESDSLEKHNLKSTCGNWEDEQENDTLESTKILPRII